MRIVDDNAETMQPLLARLQAVEDRFAIQDVLYRYASAIDVQDFTTLRTLFAEGFRGKYGAADWIEGADEVVAWIRQATDGLLWQHHLLSVYHVEIDGDRASAADVSHVASGAPRHLGRAEDDHRPVSRRARPHIDGMAPQPEDHGAALARRALNG